RYIGGAAGMFPGADLIPADLDGDGADDIVVFRSSDGMFGKWFSNPAPRGPDFVYTQTRYIGGAAGTVTGATLIPADVNGDRKMDFFVFRPSDGAFWKWYNYGGRQPDFAYQPARYLGGRPGLLPNARMIPADFNGDGKEDMIIFRSYCDQPATASLPSCQHGPTVVEAQSSVGR
ncbi:MAG TPA: FG-GAP-like repeat-containing protein, partial [Candidatus Polarisedimenticolia bacterium]|nr:FG-GAP-like repeat-containing protein [Candidatus Polarisedimenticolia bacterium]